MSHLRIRNVQTAYSGFVTVKKVERSDGNTREVAEIKDSVAFLIYNQEDDSLIFVSQFREPVALSRASESGFIIEAPAGHLKDGKSVETTIVEEAWEELRVRITEDMVKVITKERGPLFLSPGVLTEKMHLAVVFIRNKNIEGPDGVFGVEEEGEFTQRVVIPRKELEAFLASDMKTMALVEWFQSRITATKLQEQLRRLEGRAVEMAVRIRRLEIFDSARPHSPKGGSKHDLSSR